MHTALGQIPPPQSLEELSVYTQATRQGDQSLLYKSSTWSSLGAGLPPVPEKITSRIEAGEFIEMAELLPDRLGSAGDDQTKSVKTKRRLVTNIVEWVECFAIYIAVLSKKQPQRVPEMLGYLILILEAHTENAGDGWLGYDRRFRMAAAGNPSINWAAIDTTLWNLAFSGKARSARCKHCFSLSHLSKDCEWEPELPSMTPVVANPPGVSRRQICRDWNYSRRPGCPHVNCYYRHICINCAFDPEVPDKVHKVVYCPYKQSRGQPEQRY